MRSKIGSLAVVVFGLFALACNNAAPPRPVSGAAGARPRINERAIDIVRQDAIPRPDGSSFKLADFSGKVVLVDFWATWCPPCREQAPQLAELARRYPQDEFEVVGLSLNERSDQAEVLDFVKQAGMNYTIGYGRHISDAFLKGTEDETGEAPIPQLFIFGPDGKLVEHLIGYNPAHGLDYLDQIIRQQLAKK